MQKENPEGKSSFLNSAVLLDKTGKTTYEYDKIHLVPFGEYPPLQPFLGWLMNAMNIPMSDTRPPSKTNERLTTIHNEVMSLVVSAM